MVIWDEQTDIVVVGSGAAELSAATEAGASVIGFEKMKAAGGNTRISDGSLTAPGNYLQRGVGIEDSPELFYEDMLQAGLRLNHPHRVRIVAERAAEAIELTRYGTSSWGWSSLFSLLSASWVGCGLEEAYRSFPTWQRWRRDRSWSCCCRS
jgi:succinate dehydrogenase/fumarate reductase flavoprotein subunit